MVRQSKTAAIRVKYVPGTDTLDVYGLDPYIIKLEPGSRLSQYSDRFLMKCKAHADAREEPIMVVPITDSEFKERRRLYKTISVEPFAARDRRVQAKLFGKPLTPAPVPQISASQPVDPPPPSPPPAAKPKPPAAIKKLPPRRCLRFQKPRRSPRAVSIKRE